MTLPEILARDLNSKYKECQKLVDFLKHLGFKGDINLNNILFPSTRDMLRIFEFTLELVTNYDGAALEFEQNFSDKNFMKIKIAKQIHNWGKETWIIPELKYSKELVSDVYSNVIANGKNSTHFLKLEKQKLNLIKKKINGLNIQIPENSKITT
jgi:hypothetical protein